MQYSRGLGNVCAVGLVCYTAGEHSSVSWLEGETDGAKSGRTSRPSHGNPSSARGQLTPDRGATPVNLQLVRNKF